MKLKLEIDLDELVQDILGDYNCEDGVDVDIKDAVKRDIIYTAKTAILKEIKDPVRKDIEERVKILVKDAYAAEVESLVKDFVKNNKIPGKYSGDPSFTVAEWVEAQFTTSIDNDKLKELVKLQAIKSSEDLKNRYDVYFATQIVVKMNEQGLLKDGVMQALKS